jgi:hypothetical protein
MATILLALPSTTHKMRWGESATMGIATGIMREELGLGWKLDIMDIISSHVSYLDTIINQRTRRGS